jgi:hypothetical protein
VWIKTAANSVQSFMIVFIYQTVNLISISAALKISFDGCIILIAAYIIYILYISYTIYICIYILYDIIALKRKKLLEL